MIENQHETIIIKASLETITKEVSSAAHDVIHAISENRETAEQIDWLIDNIEPSAIKALSRLNEHLNEIKVLDKIIQKKSLPTDYFDLL